MRKSRGPRRSDSPVRQVRREPDVLLREIARLRRACRTESPTYVGLRFPHSLRMTGLLRQGGQAVQIHVRLVAEEEDQDEVRDADEDSLGDGHVVERLVVFF